MKSILLIVAISSFSFLTASAQDDSKIRMDHTYSTHNYKHSNKAAAARQWENKTTAPVNAPGVGTGLFANYKQPLPGVRPVGGVVVPHTPEMDLTLRNYKFQRVNPFKSTPSMDSIATERRTDKQTPQTGQ